MKITLICIGKIKEQYWRDAIEEYAKRLSAYAELNITELPDEATKADSDAEIAAVLQKEGQRIREKLAALSPAPYKCALCIDGKAYDSVGLSEHVSALMSRGKSHLVFIIGGSYGIAPELVRECDERLSFSKLTFPHQMMRVIFLEQLYRCFKIMKNEPYHK